MYGVYLLHVFLHDLPSAVTRSVAPNEMESLDGLIIQESGLCHRLESRPRLPAPAACTPLDINQHNSVNVNRINSIGKCCPGQPAEVGKS